MSSSFQWNDVGMFGEVFLRGVVLVSLSVFVPNAASAQDSGFLKPKVENISGPQLRNEERVKQVLRNLEISPDWGFVKETNVPNTPNSQLIINIQDLHCNYEAQKNIAAILEYLTTTFNLKVISVEGGSGKIDITFYKELPDDKIKEQVADYFLREARINGTEYFAITTKRNISLYGAEDEKYYDKNLDAFMRALPERQSVQDTIAVLENALNILKSKIYNKKLAELDDHIVAYENGELPFENYVAYISEFYPADNLKREFSQVNQLAESIKLKNKVDLTKAEAERAELIDILSKNLARNDLEEFLKATVEFKGKIMDGVSYHNVLKKLYNGMDEKAKTLDRRFPQLSAYIEYLNKHELLDKFGLFTELDKLVERIKNGLYTSYTQKNLDQNLRIIRLLRNLYATQLLTHDLRKVDQYKEELDARKLKKFIEKEAQRLKLDLALPPDERLDEMKKSLPAVQDFYYYASQRNNILATNTLQAMSSEAENVGILVTGGFHTEGITDYLKEKRIPFVVIAPKVEKLDDTDERYINALQGKKTPFEEMIENEKEAPKKQ